MHKTLPLLLLLTISACSYLKANPAPDAGFIKHPEVLQDAHDKSPFHRGWASNYWRENKNRYKKIIIAPIDTEHMLKADWWQNQTAKTKETLEQDRQEIAAFFRKSLIEAYRNDPNKRFQVVEKPGPNTVILEIAIVELIPAKVFFNAASTVGGIFVPGVGYATAAGKGSIAIEARLRDAQTKKVYARIADRESDKTAPVNVAQYSWYQGSKRNIEDWVEQFVTLGSTPMGQQVADSSPFTLSPW